MSRGPRGGTLTQVLSAATTLTNASTDIGFGVGEEADYLFDDVRFFDPTATGEQSTIGRRYAYDARGRRVAETTFEDGVAETTYFVYPPAADLRQATASSRSSTATGGRATSNMVAGL